LYTNFVHIRIIKKKLFQ